MEMSEAPPVADEASEFRGSAPLVATIGKREAAGATVTRRSREVNSTLGQNSVPYRERPILITKHLPRKGVLFSLEV